MRWLVLLFLAIPNAKAGSITPAFTTGQIESTSTSKTVIVETIVTETIGQDIHIQCRELMLNHHKVQLFHLTQPIQTRRLLMECPLNG